jgi:mono/diheme cytochrome c family protein
MAGVLTLFMRPRGLRGAVTRARPFWGTWRARGARAAVVAVIAVAFPAVVACQKPAGAPPDTAGITPAMVDAGRALFHGQGTCFACHGQKLEGTQLAPTLIKKDWKDAKNGELGNIFNVVTHGVPGTLMVAFPGGISKADAANAAAYVWSVNHRGAKP